ncbi:MAG: hypothetical protein WDN48_04070 [Pseudolabrys sp.]
MTRIDPAHLEHQLKRWMRPDAHHFVRPDWRRFVRPGFEDEHPFALYERKYSPDQPRAPAGSREGGQWTSDGGGNGQNGVNDPHASDASPDPVRPGDQYAQNRPRGSASGGVTINGQRVEPTPGQSARLAVVEAQAQDAIRRVQELDPNWSPKPSAYESVEGLIASYRADAQQAQDRISELQRVGIGPGPFAGDSIPARGPERDFTAAERREINRIGSETGCHTCGTRDPGTLYGDYVLDHQIPTRLNSPNAEQRLYPQCLSCSLRQGGVVKQLIR